MLAGTNTQSTTSPNLTTQYLQLAEGTLAYTDYGHNQSGTGEVVLMLPGMGALRSEYRFLAPKLYAAGYRPVTLDLRGQGDSSVPWPSYTVPDVGGDILALIDHLDAGPVHLIGTSYSPAPAVWAAVERPAAVRSLVLINGFARAPKLSPFMQAAYWFMLNNPWRVRTWRMFYRSLYPTHKPDDFEAYLDQLSANLAQPGRFDAVKALPAAPREPWETRMGQVQAPALVIMGSKDPDFADPVAEGKYFAQKLGGTLAVVEGAGHYPQTEMPDKVAQLVLDFYKQG